MIKKLFALIIALLPLAATAAPVIEGVYVSHPSKRLHLESWDYEGTVQYGLTLANLNGESSYVVASKARKVQDNQKVIFNTPENRYITMEDEVDENAGCLIEATFSPNEIQLKSFDGCRQVAKYFNGSYAYSKASSYVPSKYWGKWGECEYPADSRDAAFLNATSGSTSGTYKFDVIGVGYSSPKEINLTGVYHVEGTQSVSEIKFEYLPNNKVRTTNDITDSPTVHEKCKG
jgi:hypothetical protein